MKRNQIGLAALGIFFSLAGEASAVAIYDALQHIDTFDRPGYYVDIGVGGVLKTGNTDFRTISGSTYLGSRRNRNVFMISGQGEFTEAKGEEVANNSLEHLRWRYYLTRSEVWASEVYAQHERDIFRRIRLRALAGGAIRYAFPQAGPLQAAVGVGAFVETIRINATESEPDSGDRYDAVRNSTYLTLAVVPESGGRFGLTAYYQPRIDKPSDYRASCKAFIEAKVAKVIKLEIFSGVAYDVSPASSVAKTDTTTGFKLGIEFAPPTQAIVK